MIHGLMSSSGGYCILGTLRTGVWEKGHILSLGASWKGRGWPSPQPRGWAVGRGCGMVTLRPHGLGRLLSQTRLKAQVPDLWLLPSSHTGAAEGS